MCTYIPSLSKFSSTDNLKSCRNFYETEIIAIACLKIVHTMQGLLKKCKEALNCFVISACIFILLSQRKLLSKTLTQAYTKIPCVNTEQPMLVHKITFSQSKQIKAVTSCSTHKIDQQETDG